MSENREDDRGYCETYDCKYYENLKECQKQNCWYRYYSKEHIKNIQIKKQLQAKEQECEKLKTQILSLQTMEIEELEKLKQEKTEIKKYLGISDKSIMQRLEELQEFKDELKISEDRYKQECEELKKQLDKYLNQEEEEIRQLNNDNKLDDILSAIEKANDKMEKESNYKQALDKIENYANNTCATNQRTCNFYYSCSDCGRLSEKELIDKIQDVINKAKDGE